jgi:alpha/beta superfamily hydrolase
LDTIEETVFFQAGKLKIEGLYAESGTGRGVVISHPHPQMGGSMWNNVVETLVTAFFTKGYSTLRFNFRGVGRSEGMYDDGTGEQEDVLGAVDYLAGKGKTEVVLAGYSFGAWINVKVAVRPKRFADVILVSPPINFLEFDFSDLTGKVGLMMSGDRDQFSSVEGLTTIASRIHCLLEIVKGADHFYFEKEYGIAECLDQYLH